MSNNDTKSWLKTENPIGDETFSQAFWKKHREELASGEFWADRIKKFYGEPVERLRIAIENLPLPAAFREAAIATRTLIRELRKDNKPYAEQLALLYWLAAVNSFSIPYSEILKEPGYNVIEAIPGKILKGLPFTYNELGYKELKLLNATDIKWLIETWGDPRQHTTLHQLHKSVWDEYENMLISKRSNRRAAFNEELKSLITNDSKPPLTSNPASIEFQPTATINKNNPSVINIVIAFTVLAFFLWLLF